MKRKQVLALILSASVVATTVMPAYAEEMVRPTISTEEATNEEAVNNEAVSDKTVTEEDDTTKDVDAQEPEETPEADQAPVTPVNTTEEEMPPAPEDQELPTGPVSPEDAPSTDRYVESGETVHGDFRVIDSNFMAHYTKLNDTDVEITYMEPIYWFPDYKDNSMIDASVISIPSTVEYDGVTYNVTKITDIKKIDGRIRHLTVPEGVTSFKFNPNDYHLNELILPSTLVEVEFNDVLHDKTPRIDLEWIIGYIKHVTLSPKNTYIKYNEEKNCIYLAERGGGECENVGDRFYKEKFGYEVVADGVVDIVQFFPEEGFGEELVVSNSVDFKGKTFKVRAVDMRDTYETKRMYGIKTLTFEEGIEKVYFDNSPGYGYDEKYRLGSVTTINIPSTISFNEFDIFPGAKTVNVAASNPYYTSQDGILYNKDMTELIFYPKAKVMDTFTIPSSVKTVNEDAFYDTKGIGTLIIPDTVETLGDSAVYSMPGLKHVIVEGKIENCGNSNFSANKNMETVTVKDMTVIPQGALSLNNNLKEIIIDGTVEVIMPHALKNNPSLEKYTVRNSETMTVKDDVLFLGSSICSYPSNKAGDTYVVPEGTTKIGPMAFDRTNNLKTLVCPEGLIFSAASINNPVQPVDVYTKGNIELATKRSAIFISTVGGNVYVQDQEAMDSILNSENKNILDGMSASIKVLPIDSVSVESRDMIIKIGESEKIKYTINPYYATEELIFEGTDGICNVDENGVVTGTGVGRGTVTLKTAKGDVVINVKVIKPLVAITLDQTEKEITEGESFGLKLKLDPEDASDVGEAVWTSDNPEVAEVSNKGHVKALKPGTAIIKVTVNGKEATCKVTVKRKEIALDSITLSETKVTLNEKETKDLNITLNPTNTTVDTTATWKSDNESVATVDANGKITAVSKGTCTITVTVAGKKATCTVTVKRPLKSISLSETAKTVTEGDKFDLDVVLNPVDADDVKAATWSSDNESVAVVDKDGNVTTKKPGTANIKAVVNGKEATCTLIVKKREIALDSITLSETKLTLNENEVKNLDITLNPTNTTVDKTATWKSDNESVATVDANGVVKATGKGACTITVTVAGKTATCKVTVKRPLKDISLSETAKTVTEGDKFDLDVVLNPVDADDVKAATWSSDNEKVAVVDKDGNVTTKKPGTANIKAVVNGKESTCKVTVKRKEIALDSITLSETKVALNEKATKDLDVTLNPTNTTVDKTATWESDNESIATVDANGKITAVSKGTCTITVTVAGKKATCTVTVKRPLKSISLNETTKAMVEGSQFKLHVIVNPVGADDVKAATWSSDNEKVAVVDKDGNVTANKPGTANIKAVVNGKEAICKVTVVRKEVALDSITLSETKITLNEKATKDLDVTLNPTNTTVDTTATWKSDNESVATVDANGNVTAVGKGTCTITVTVAGKTATCKVTVKRPLKDISLSETAKTVTEGDKFDLDVVLNPVDADDVKAATWSSDNEKVAVVDKDGNVTTKKPGTANIKAVVNGKEATCKVTVKRKEIALDSITLSETKVTLNEKATKDLDVTLNPTNTTVDKTATWESDNESIATVDANGKITAVSKGTCTITVTVAGKKATCTVTVKRPLESITLNQKEAYVVVGKGFKLNVSLHPTDPSDVETATWTSDNEEVATVDANGMVTTHSVGTANVQVEINGKVASCTVHVKDDEIALESITMSQTELTLDEKESAELTVTFNPSNTTVDRTVTWSSDNEDVATVDANGKVTGLKKGTCVITARVGNPLTRDGGYVATCVVTVKEVIPLTPLEPAKPVEKPEEKPEIPEEKPEVKPENPETKPEVKPETKPEEKPNSSNEQSTEKEEEKAPSTGDPFNVGLLGASALASGGVLAKLMKKFKKKK